MQFSLKAGFVAVTVASTANAYSHRMHMGLHARQFFNTTLIPTGTGFVPTGISPTGIATGTGGGSPPGPTVIPPFANTTSTIPSTSTIVIPPTDSVTLPPTVTDGPGPIGPGPVGPGGVVTSTSTELMTTSTIFTTIVSTITSCPPTVVTKCPEEVVTITIPISTTVCPVTEQPQPTGPVVIVVPVPPSEAGNGGSGGSGASGDEHGVTSVIGGGAPYPTPGQGQGGVAPPQGTGTGVYYPTDILTTQVLTPPQQTGGPILDQSAAGKVGVSSVLALVFASVLALMY